MKSINDSEFGEIIIHKRRGSRNIHIKVGANGRLVATAPYLTPVIFIKQVINGSRDELRKLTHNAQSTGYIDGQQVGQSHKLAVIHTQMINTPNFAIERNRLLVYLPPGFKLDDPVIQQQIRDNVIKILRKEAKKILPTKLDGLAKSNNFIYQKIRFSHASGRWGSCSSSGTISLNIALMKLPDSLINYVLIHELCHTRHMNHSKDFWAEVAKYDSLYKLHKRQISKYHPSV